MNKKANPAMIGGFVVGAVILLIAGVIIFGSGRFSDQKDTFILFFEGNVAGLRIGAPVTFKGVKIGAVKKINLNFDIKKMTLFIPVFIEVDYTQIQSMNGSLSKKKRNSVITDLVDKGLRGQLKLQSLLTGQLYVEFDFHPKTEARFITKKRPHLNFDLTELPTIPSDIEKLQKEIKKIPLDTLISQVISALNGVERLVNSPEISDALKAFGRTMKNVDELAAVLNREAPPLAASIKKTFNGADQYVKVLESKTVSLTEQLHLAITDIRAMIESADRLVVNLDKRTAPVSADLRKTLQSAQSSLKQADKTLKAIEGISSKNSSLGYKLHNTLDQLSSAARSIKVFAEYLERHPEALIQGKGRK